MASVGGSSDKSISSCPIAPSSTGLDVVFGTGVVIGCSGTSAPNVAVVSEWTVGRGDVIVVGNSW